MKLNKCPFCNSDFVGTCACLPEPNLLWQVTCHACNAEGPTRDTERKAVNAWNKRKTRCDVCDEEVERQVKRTESRQRVSDATTWTMFDRTNKCNHTFDNPRCPHC